MSKSGRLLAGILSLLPLVMMVIYFVVFFSFMITIFKQAGQQNILPEMMFEHIGWIMGIAALMLICHLGLLIYFIIHVVGNTVIDGTERIIWVLIFIFAGMIGFPVYWYMRIWNTPATAYNI